jgi:uncharacterized protein (DUF433 family)
LDRTPSETVVRVLEEGLREREFPYIVFKDTAVGREAFLSGTRLKVWQIVDIVEDFGGDLATVSEQFSVAEYQLKAALDYAATYPDEISQARASSHRSLEELRQLLPNLEVFEYHEDPPRLTRA